MAAVDESLALVAGRVPGLRAIMVTDRDGIVVMRYPRGEAESSASSGGNEAAFAIAADQVSHFTRLLSLGYCSFDVLASW